MLNEYFHINEVTGVSIFIGKDGGYSIEVCSLSIKKARLQFEKKLIGLNSLEQLTGQLPQKSLIALAISGKGVLQKRVEKITEISQQSFGTVLPNASLEDFYVQNFTIDNHSFVSAIRKTDVNRLIEQLQMLGFIPVMLSLGPFSVRHVLQQLNVYEGDVVFAGHYFERNDWLELTNYRYDESLHAPFVLKIESEAINESLLLPYAAGFQLLLADKIDPVQAEVPLLSQALDTAINKKRIQAYGFVTLVCVFALLLANFLMLSWLTTQNERLLMKVSTSVQSANNMEQLATYIKAKDSLLKTLGWENHVSKPGMIDQVAGLLPADITWTTAVVDPMDNMPGRNLKSVLFSNRRIRISGNSERVIPVNEWIARLKTKPWSKNVQLESYTFNSELNIGQFSVIIDY